MEGEACWLCAQNEGGKAAAFGSRNSSFSSKSADFALLGTASAWCWEAVDEDTWGFSLLYYLWSPSKSNLKYFALESELTWNTVFLQSANLFLLFLPSRLAEYEPVAEIRSTEVTSSDKWAGKIIVSLNISFYSLPTIYSVINANADLLALSEL